MNHINKGTRACALVLAAALLLSGCGASESEEADNSTAVNASAINGVPLKDTYTADDVFSVGCDSTGIYNPLHGASPTNTELTPLMYDYVYNVDENFNVWSDVVLSYETSDNQWWVFTVDTTIPFTDGTTLTAADVAYSIQRAQRSDYYSGRLKIIYGCSSVGEDRFAISTVVPNSMLPSMLTIPIIKKGSIEEEVPAGSGMYKLSEDGKYLELNTENRYASEAPLKKIYLEPYDTISEKINSYEDSRVDIVSNDPTSAYNLGYGSSNETRYIQTTNMHFLGFNLNSLFFTDLGRRKAMLWMIDRDNWYSSIMNYKATVSTLPVLPTSNLYDPNFAKTFYYDKKLSMHKFTEAGVRDMDNDGVLEFDYAGICVELNLKFIVNGDASQKVAEAKAITKDLNDMGIKTTLYELTSSEYITALKEGDYDFYYGEIKMTPDWNFSLLFEPESEMNYIQCQNGDYAQAYYNYLAAPEIDRYNAFQAAVQLLMTNALFVPIGFEKHEVLTHRGVVSGLSATQYNLYNNFQSWTINTSPAQMNK